MIGLLLAVSAGYGVYLVYTSVAFGWEGIAFAPSALGARMRRDRIGDFLVQAGLDQARPAELVGICAVLALVGAGLAYAVFGGVLPPLLVGLFAASVPLTSAAARRRGRLERAREAWPRMIEEVRLLATSAGQSIPQALFSVGTRAPEEIRPAFEAAHREWLISTDFEGTVGVLKQRLADPTADSVCETLLIAHQVGGSDVDKRLAALIEDRIADLQGRKDAQARQAGVRFARLFVLIVPAGMAGVGLSIGEGRAAYASSGAQLAVVVGLLILLGCWGWASRMLRLPDEERVFTA
ncbi:MAG TPA: hypothetical protein VM324_16055 [Egibacteraceae bacterium]|nr:hypothetical protein [Egibacteraceae bacterium]